MYYADDLRNDMDINIANEIYNDISSSVDNVTDYNIIIVGRNNQKLPESAMSIELMGMSLFNSDLSYRVTTSRILYTWNIEGKNTPRLINNDDTSKALEYIKNNDIKCYPQDGYIQIIDNLIIVKLSNNI